MSEDRSQNSEDSQQGGSLDLSTQSSVLLHYLQGSKSRSSNVVLLKRSALKGTRRKAQGTRLKCGTESIFYILFYAPYAVYLMSELDSLFSSIHTLRNRFSLCLAPCALCRYRTAIAKTNSTQSQIHCFDMD
jgi:hypothetical protein